MHPIKPEIRRLTQLRLYDPLIAAAENRRARRLFFVLLTILAGTVWLLGRTIGLW
jgi:hypothetical protein